MKRTNLLSFCNLRANAPEDRASRAINDVSIMSKVGTALDKINEIDDKELVSRILQAANSQEQRRWQEELYRRYSGKIYYKCISLIKSPDSAQDLAHDIFIKIFLNLSRYKGNAPFYSWVFAIVYNQCFDYLNKKKKNFTVDISALPAEPAADETALQDKIFREARLSELEQAFQQLKEFEQLLLSMHYQDGLPIRVMSQSLNLSESAIKMRLKRSRDKLAGILNRQENEKVVIPCHELITNKVKILA